MNWNKIRIQLDVWSLYYREYIVGFIIGFIIGAIILWHTHMLKVENEQEKDGDKVLKVRLGIEHTFNDQKSKREEKNILYKE